MAKFMGFSLTSPAPEKCDPTAKNRVWGFFGDAPKTSRDNRPQSLQPRRENHPTTTKVASGRAYWPSRDPIEERGGVNLYAMVGNNAVARRDVLGQICDDECECGEIQITDINLGFHVALRNEANLTPDEKGGMMSALDQIADLVALKKLGPLKLNKLLAKMTKLQEKMAEAIVDAIPGIMDGLGGREGYVMWYQIEGECCEKECCWYTLWIAERCAWEDSKTKWFREGEPGELGKTKGELLMKLPELVEKAVKTLCN